MSVEASTNPAGAGSNPAGAESNPAASNPAASNPVALVDLLDRVLATGVVVSGELTLAIAEVDLVHISLRALISSVRASPPARTGHEGDPT